MSNSLANIVALEREKRRRRRAVPAWSPLPGPQTLAFASTADIIGYGGEPGGGKTDMLLGFAIRKQPFASTAVRSSFAASSRVCGRSLNAAARS